MMKRVFRHSEDDPCLPPAKQSKNDAPRRGVYMWWERKLKQRETWMWLMYNVYFN